MIRIGYLLAGLVLGVAASAIAHEAPDTPCPPCSPTLTPEQSAAVEALRVKVEALAK